LRQDPERLEATGIEAHRELFDRIQASVAAIRQLRAEAFGIVRGQGLRLPIAGAAADQSGGEAK
jgi:hypothetical protein